MPRRWSALAGTLAVLVGSAGLIAADASAEQQAAAPRSACEVRSRSEAVAVLICRADLEEAALVAAGKAACGTRVPCNAWMWDDASKAPEKAPARDADMPKATAAAAVGIWANDTKVFVRVRRAKP
jgi:hypothetical protein